MGKMKKASNPDCQLGARPDPPPAPPQNGYMLTKREYIALSLHSALLSSNAHVHQDDAAKEAVKQADALIKYLEISWI